MADTDNISQADSDEAAYRKESASLKLKNGILSGIGGPAVFGIVAALVGALMKYAGITEVAGSTAAATGTTALAHTAAAAGSSMLFGWLGIGALVVAGFACIYLANKYYTASVALDQEHQAKRNAQALQSGKDKAPVVDLQPPPLEPPPTAITGVNKAETPDTAASKNDGKEWGWITATTGPGGNEPKVKAISPFYSDKEKLAAENEKAEAEKEHAEHAHHDQHEHHDHTRKDGKSWVEASGAQTHEHGKMSDKIAAERQENAEKASASPVEKPDNWAARALANEGAQTAVGV